MPSEVMIARSPPVLRTDRRESGEADPVLTDQSPGRGASRIIPLIDCNLTLVRDEHGVIVHAVPAVECPGANGGKRTALGEDRAEVDLAAVPVIDPREIPELEGILSTR